MKSLHPSVHCFGDRPVGSEWTSAGRYLPVGIRQPFRPQPGETAEHNALPGWCRRFRRAQQFSWESQFDDGLYGRSGSDSALIPRQQPDQRGLQRRLPVIDQVRRRQSAPGRSDGRLSRRCYAYQRRSQSSRSQECDFQSRRPDRCQSDWRVDSGRSWLYRYVAYADAVVFDGKLSSTTICAGLFWRKAISLERISAVRICPGGR